MRAVYIDFNPEKNVGVRRKISYQIDALRNLGVDTVHAFYNNGYYFGEEKIFGLHSSSTIVRKVYEIKIVKEILSHDFSGFDFIYLRYVRLTPWFYWMLRVLSKKVSKVYVELATYPYDGEVKKYSPLTISDNFFRTKISSYVDAIFCFGITEGRVWGIPSVNMTNAINPADITFVNVEENNKEKQSIDLISVSSLASWHAYDRLIDSMNELPSDAKSKVKFHVVGDGPKKVELERLVQQYNLNSHVIFYGSLQGEKLDEVYAHADVGVASLGLYRIGLDEITPIKMSEYAAKGLPFILANKDPRFEQADFVYRVPNKAGSFDLEKMITWYQNLKATKASIRKFAEDNLTWETQMKKVVDHFNRSKTQN